MQGFRAVCPRLESCLTSPTPPAQVELFARASKGKSAAAQQVEEVRSLKLALRFGRESAVAKQIRVVLNQQYYEFLYFCVSRGFRKPESTSSVSDTGGVWESGELVCTCSSQSSSSDQCRSKQSREPNRTISVSICRENSLLPEVKLRPDNFKIKVVLSCAGIEEATKTEATVLGLGFSPATEIGRPCMES